jgi:hypothetical protein
VRHADDLVLVAGYRSLRGVLEPGERLLGASTEPGSTGDIWLVSDRATYVSAKASRTNQRAGHDKLLRILHTAVRGIDEARSDGQTLLTLAATFDEATVEVSGRFSIAEGGSISRLLSERTGVEVQTAS